MAEKSKFHMYESLMERRQAQGKLKLNNKT